MTAAGLKEGVMLQTILSAEIWRWVDAAVVAARDSGVLDLVAVGILIAIGVAARRLRTVEGLGAPLVVLPRRVRRPAGRG